MDNKAEIDEEGQRILALHKEALKVSLADVQAQDKQDKTVALKSLRVEINTAMAHAKTIADTLIQRGPGGRELSLCFTNLQYARMMAGEALGEIGHKLPEEYRDEARPHEEGISADEALWRFGALGLSELLRHGLIECTQNGYVLKPAIPSDKA